MTTSKLSPETMIKIREKSYAIDNFRWWFGRDRNGRHGVSKISIDQVALVGSVVDPIENLYLDEVLIWLREQCGPRYQEFIEGCQGLKGDTRSNGTRATANFVCRMRKKLRDHFDEC
jgi:hypothetical protein